MGKGDKITVLSIGRRFNALRDGVNRPDFEECGFQVVHTENDHNLPALINTWNPNVILTFGDWDQHKLLAGAPMELRRRWIALPNDATDDQVGPACLNCYVGTLKESPEPLVSVFTAAFRPGAKIFRPLKSLMSETYPNWEWIIVDDSDDRQTWRLLQELSAMDPRVKPFKGTRHSGRIGELKRWACGLASGELLVELDHDDELTAHCLGELVRAFNEMPDGGMFYTDDAEVFEDTMESFEYPDGWAFGFGAYRREVYQGREYSVAIAPPINAQTIRHIVGVPNHARAWRRTVYFDIGGHNPELHVADDYDLIVRTWLASRLVHVPTFGYIQYRNREGNTTFNRNSEIQRLVRIVQEQYEERIQARLIGIGEQSTLDRSALLACDEASAG